MVRLAGLTMWTQGVYPLGGKKRGLLWGRPTCYHGTMLTLTQALSAHGYATSAEARADMVALVCLSPDCGCITAVTPPEGQRDEAGRLVQVAAYRHILVCCDPMTSYIL
jgi:hypothetical protein